MKSLCRLLIACLLIWVTAPSVSAQDEGGDAGGDVGGDTGGDTGGADEGGDTGSTGGDTGSTGGNTGSTGGDTGSTGGNTGSTGGTTGSTGGSEEGESAALGDDTSPGRGLGGSLGASIRLMIQTLEAQKYEEFLETFLDPAEKEKLLKATTIAAFAPRFGSKSAGLIQILKSLRGKIPQYTSDGKYATFVLDTSTDGIRDQIRFHQVEKRWCLMN